MKLAYSDPTPRWVPFVLVAVVTIAGWFGAVFANVTPDVATASVMALALGAALFIAVLLQGRLYWTGQVDSLSMQPGQVEVVTMRWVGWGSRMTFAPEQTSRWTATPKHDDPSKLSSVSFVVNGVELSMSFLSPRVADFDLLSHLAPDFFRGLRIQYGLTAR